MYTFDQDTIFSNVQVILYEILITEAVNILHFEVI